MKAYFDKLKDSWRKHPSQLNTLSLFVIIFVMLFMTWCSPLIHYSYDATDMNVSMAIGKAMAHGQVYFKDIFEQRGLYFYFLQFFSGFMSHYAAKTIMWVIEILNLFGFYFIAQQTAMLKVDRYKAQLYALAMTIMIPFAPPFSNMYCPEELNIIPIAYSVYLMLYFNKYRKVSLKQIFVLGLLMGYVANVKYSLLGSICGFYLAYGLYLLFKKQFKLFVQTVITAFAGLFAGFIPVVIYYLPSGAIGRYFHYYFFDNASSFSLFHHAGGEIIVYLSYLSAILLITIIPLIFAFKDFDKALRLMIIEQFLFALTGILAIGRSGVAYSLPLVVFLATTAVGYLNSYKLFYQGIKNKKLRYSAYGLTIVLFGILIGQSIYDGNFIAGRDFRTPSYKYFAMGNKQLPDYRLSHMIDEYGGGKTITFGSIPDTLYNYNHEYPKTFYFDQTTMSYKRYPESYDAQVKDIKERNVRWAEVQNGAIQVIGHVTHHETRKRAHEISQMNKKIKFGNQAMVTASSEYRKKHPQDFEYIVTGPIANPHSNTMYLMNFYIYKPLLKNYALVALSIQRSGWGDLKHSRIQSYNTHMLFVDRNYMKKYPELKKYELDIHNLAKMGQEGKVWIY